jgi:hypothetical protein
MDHSNPCVNSLCWITERTLGAVDANGARVRAVEAGEDVHQRGLASAILSKEAEHLALVDGDRDAVICEHARELLGDALQF